MSYSGYFKPERYALIAGIMDKIRALEPGGRLVVKGLSPGAQSRVRILLYDWFYHLNLKARFRIKQEPGRLTVIDLRVFDPVTVVIEEPLASKEEGKLMEELIERYEESEAVLECWVKEGRINLEKAASLRVKLEEVMS